jgi:hypothetical protein
MSVRANIGELESLEKEGALDMRREWDGSVGLNELDATAAD